MSALRRARSRALTGPSPSATTWRSSPFTVNLMMASAPTDSFSDGRDVLIRRGVASHRADVDAAFVREDGLANVGLARVGSDVCDFGNKMRKRGDFLELAGFEATLMVFKFEIGDDLDQVGVAAAFA